MTGKRRRVSKKGPSEIPKQTPEEIQYPADVTIDGSQAEGGGQILRISLALAAVLEHSVCVRNIRKGRSVPGLSAQHLAGAQLVGKIASAPLQGDVLRSTTLLLKEPQASEASLPLKSAVSTAGATSLVLQAALPVALKFLPGLSVQEEKVSMELGGGTSVLNAPTSDYLKYVFAPNLRHFGVELKCDVVRHGFFPKGGGMCRITIDKSNCLKADAENGKAACMLRACSLEKRGTITSIKGSLVVRGKEYVSAEVVDAMVHQTVQVVRKFTRSQEGYPDFNEEHIAVQQLAESEAEDDCIVLTLFASASNQTVLGSSTIWSPNEAGRFGKATKTKKYRWESRREEKYEKWRQTAAECGQRAAQELCETLQGMPVVDPHMADQLCILMAMACGRSRLLLSKPTSHLETAVQVLQQFGIGISLEGISSTNNYFLSCEGVGSSLRSQESVIGDAFQT